MKLLLLAGGRRPQPTVSAAQDHSRQRLRIVAGDWRRVRGRLDDRRNSADGQRLRGGLSHDYTDAVATMVAGE